VTWHLRTQDFYCHLNPSFFIFKKEKKKMCIKSRRSMWMTTMNPTNAAPHQWFNKIWGRHKVKLRFFFFFLVSFCLKMFFLFWCTIKIIVKLKIFSVWQKQFLQFLKIIFKFCKSFFDSEFLLLKSMDYRWATPGP
jgi:hypothetical protein